MVSILAFDSNTMKQLLTGVDGESFFSAEYPIFYRNKSQIEGEEYNNAIDIALKNN